MLASEHAPSAAEARLHLIRDRQAAVARAERTQRRQEVGWGHDEATFPLHGLDEHRGDLLGGDAREEGAFEHGGPLATAAISSFAAVGALVAVGIRQRVHVEREGTE